MQNSLELEPASFSQQTDCHPDPIAREGIKVVDGQILKRAREGSWFEDNSPTWFDHWRTVENEINAARENANVQLASDSVVLGVTFSGQWQAPVQARD